MPRTKRPLQEIDPNTNKSPPDASNKKRKSTDTNAPSDARTESQTEDSTSWHWVPRCQPSSLRDSETPEPDYENDPAYTVKEIDGERNIFTRIPCTCQTPLSEVLASNPSHEWLLTSQGSEILNEQSRALFTRRPDDFNMYIFNDFEAYAMIEIQENFLQSFKDAYVSRKMGAEEKMRGCWAALEAGAVWLVKEETGLSMWRMAEDGERVARLMRLWGAAVLAMIRMMEERGVFRVGTDAPVRNLRLVLGLLVLVFGTGEDTFWTYSVVEWAREKGGFELERDEWDHELVRNLKERKEGVEMDEKKVLKKFNFRKRFKKYAREYSVYASLRIGGTRFDIAGMSTEERAHYAFGEEDPLKPNMVPPKTTQICTR